MADSSTPNHPRSEHTRTALIESALALFGHKGFEATSTRELAARAGTNAASIAYHFGNKDGLRKACALFIVERIGIAMKPALAGDGPALDQISAETRIAYAMKVMAGVMLNRDQADFAPFLLREITTHGEVFEIMYSNLFLPMHSYICGLWAAATGGQADSEQVRLEVFAAIGQLAYFRVAKLPVLTRMAWADYSASEAELIGSLCADNVRAQIATARARNMQVLAPK